MTADRLKKQLEFIVETDRLKQILRQTLVIDDRRQENDAEHSWHLALMAIFLSEHANQPDLDILKVVKMVIIHDLVEIYAGDTFCYDYEAAKDKNERETAAAQKIFGEDVWFRWRYNIRLQAVLAQYWIDKNDLVMARKHAEASEEAARTHQSKKHRAWALKILGEIALLEDNVGGARKYYEDALGILTVDPCPTIAWKVLKGRADLAKQLGDVAGSDDFRGRARAIVKNLADSLPEDKIRIRFLKSRSVELI